VTAGRDAQRGAKRRQGRRKITNGT